MGSRRVTTTREQETLTNCAKFHTCICRRRDEVVVVPLSTPDLQRLCTRESSNLRCSHQVYGHGTSWCTPRKGSRLHPPRGDQIGRLRQPQMTQAHQMHSRVGSLQTSGEQTGCFGLGHVAGNRGCQRQAAGGDVLAKCEPCRAASAPANESAGARSSWQLPSARSSDVDARCSRR